MTDKLLEIFERQRQYLETLAPIYRRNSFPDGTMPFSLNGRHDQEYFRLLAWRITEEIVEAVQLHYECTDHFEDYTKKFNEEVADVFHFFVELCLATGVTPQYLCDEFAYDSSSPDLLEAAFNFCGTRPDQTIPQSWAFVIHKLGIAMHELRQRPWRTDDRPTDKQRFYAAMAAAFITFISTCKRSGIDADALHAAYFAKNKVNEERRNEQVWK